MALGVALGAATLLGACTETGNLTPTAQTVTCLPKGVYLGEAFGAHYTEAQKAAIDALRVLNCPDPVSLGYGAPA
jgi:hypothetical protein